MHKLYDYKLQTNHQLIRYLHSRLITQQERHNPIATNLRRVIQRIEEAFQNAYQDNTQIFRRMFLHDFEPRDVEPGMSAAGTLAEIAIGLRDVCRFTSCPGDLAERFLASPDEPGFAQDVQQLATLLLQVRRSQALSFDDLTKLRELRRSIRDEVFGPPVQELLMRYIVPLKHTL